MAAPQIPNLLAGRGRGRLRGAGTSSAAVASGDEGGPSRNDRIIRETDADASISRISAVQAGYLEDAFAHEFAPPAPSGGVHRRFPIINRGTYARTTAIDRLVDDFLQAEPNVRKQVISLGAGSDTRYFRMCARQDPPDVLYHELDFVENTRRKLAAIRKVPAMQARFEGATMTEDEAHAANYHLHAVDLRTLSEPEPPYGEAGLLNGIDPDLPTLLLSECCLTYLKPEAADAVVAYFLAGRLSPSTPVGLALYEPINPFDSFGKVMVANLASRGIVLQTLHKYSSLDAQIKRLAALGLKSGQRAVDVDFLFEHWIDDEEKARVDQVEMLDEVEELKLLLKHYCVAWAWKDGSDPSQDIWRHWKMLPNRQIPD